MPVPAVALEAVRGARGAELRQREALGNGLLQIDATPCAAVPPRGAREGSELCRGAGGDASVSLWWDLGTVSPPSQALDPAASHPCEKDPP